VFILCFISLLSTKATTRLPLTLFADSPWMLAGISSAMPAPAGCCSCHRPCVRLISARCWSVCGLLLGLLLPRGVTFYIPPSIWIQGDRCKVTFYRLTKIKLSQQSSCQSIQAVKAFNRIYCSHLNLFYDNCVTILLLQKFHYKPSSSRKNRNNLVA